MTLHQFWQWFLETGWILLVVPFGGGAIGMTIGILLKKFYINK